MKACIFDIKRFAIHDGPGIRVTVFFKGCPLSCQWCHNPEGIPGGIDKHNETVEFDGIQIRRDIEVGKYIDPDDLVSEIEKDRVFMDESGGGVTFSGGEPLFQADALIELLDLCRNKGIHTTVDTSGYAPAKTMQAVCEKSDLILYDLKSIDDTIHKKSTGVSNKSILRNLDIVLRSGTETIVRIPFVPGFNDNLSDMRAMLDFLEPYQQPEQVDILPYHSYANHKYIKFYIPGISFAIPGHAEISETKRIFKAAGYRVSTGG